MNRKEFAEFLLGKTEHTKDEYEKMYPERNLEEGAIVTRFAPSPTGFVHMGSLYASFADLQLAKQSNGVCILRIEDTDGKRTVENGVQGIIDDFKNLGIISILKNTPNINTILLYSQCIGVASSIKKENNDINICINPFNEYPIMKETSIKPINLKLKSWSGPTNKNPNIIDIGIITINLINPSAKYVVNT